MYKHARNFGEAADEIAELTSLLAMATALGVELHVNWNAQWPGQWELRYIANSGAIPGSGSHILSLLTDAADLHRKAIVGIAQNTSNSRLPPSERLLRWYRKHGFICTVCDEYGVPIKRPSAS